MSAIIVVENKSVKQVLSRLISAEGISPVYLARNSLEAARQIKKFRASLEFVFLDEGIPHSEQEQVLSQLEHGVAAIGLASSPRRFRKMFKRVKTPQRLDFVLPKPFGRKTLLFACQKASERRQARKCALILFLTNPQADSLSLKLISSIRERSHWKELVVVDSVDAFKRSLLDYEVSLGGLILDEEALRQLPSLWLLRFKKDARRKGVVVALVTPSADQARSTGGYAQMLVRKGPLHPPELAHLIQKMSVRLLAAFQARKAIRAARSLSSRKKYREAARVIKSILIMEPEHADALAALAQIFQKRKKLSQAVKYFEKALASHPVMPGVYAQLLPLLKTKSVDLCEAMSERAFRLCDGNPGVRKYLDKQRARR